MIDISKNLEFLGYFLHIAEPHVENTLSSDLYPIRRLLDEKRAAFHKDPLVLDIFTMGEDLPYTFFVELFLIMDELPHHTEFVIPAKFLLKHHLDTLGDQAFLAQLLKKLNAFYQKSAFESFWLATQPYYAQLRSKTQAEMPEEKLFSAMERFYGRGFLVYEMIPSLTLWSAGFGFEMTEERTAIFAFGTLGNPNSFDANFFRTLAIHEFGHAFANAQLSTYCAGLI